MPAFVNTTADSDQQKGEQNMKESANRLKNKEDLMRKETGKKFYCINGIHDIADIEIPNFEPAYCPNCGEPICPNCAMMYKWFYTSERVYPSSEEEFRQYMESCDIPPALTRCKECGDSSPEFMLRFLNSVNAPVPQEYKNYRPVPRLNVSYFATPTVASLPDFGDIVEQVKTRWEKGTTGIIRVQHPSGEIWGWTDRYPEEWVVTILYPSER